MTSATAITNANASKQRWLRLDLERGDRLAARHAAQRVVVQPLNFTDELSWVIAVAEAIGETIRRRPEPVASELPCSDKVMGCRICHAVDSRDHAGLARRVSVASRRVAAERLPPAAG